MAPSALLLRAALSIFATANLGGEMPLAERYTRLHEVSVHLGSETDAQGKLKLQAAYNELFSPLQDRHRLARLSSEELNILFTAANLTNFYAPSSTLVRDMSRDLRALETRGQVAPKQYSDMFRALVKLRLFDDANSLKREHPDAKVEELPLLELPPHNGAPRVLRLSEDGKKLVAESVDVNRATSIVAIGSPVCHFTQNAIKDIDANDRLRDEFERHAIWIAPQDDQIRSNEFVEWNRQHPHQQMRIAYREDEFTFVSSWNTPTFYFMRRGKVVKTVTGWPTAGNLEALLAGMDLLSGK
jgi:hypothetical protein